MTTILTEIYAHKQVELAMRKQTVPLAKMKTIAEGSDPPMDFVSELLKSQPSPAGFQKPGTGALVPGSSPGFDWPALIAEVKFASPSRGELLSETDPCSLARLYQQNGAAAISVLTDESFFKGHLDYLRRIAAMPAHLPLLCKDFISDEYQVYAARAAGADAVLLIVIGLAPARLFKLHVLVLALGMTPLIEVHTLAELHTALECAPRLIGINNRNLHDFSVNLETTCRLRMQVPIEIPVVAESGIHTRADVNLLAHAGVNAILVGEALVTAPDIPARVRELSGMAART